MPKKAPEETRSRVKDDARTLALLWRRQERPARSGLTLSTIIQTAIEVADREGLEALSMRRLAEILNVGTMSLYTHVPGKAELVDLMWDASLDGLYADPDEPKRQPGYRAGLEFVALRNRALFEAHPWLLDLNITRPVIGPNAAAKYEAELRVLDGIGLTDLEIDAVASQLWTHVFASCRWAEEERRAQQESGLTDVEWWARTLPLLESVMFGDFPVASRIGPKSNEMRLPETSTQHHFRWGVEVVVQTVASLVRDREAQR
ncbi:MAG TPA: TetR/AcrR family transcriptional regulator [Polyangiales bacterium]|nr:TetR/AcrR family transcriptional regulator [Polyangiales bacterium]